MHIYLTRGRHVATTSSDIQTHFLTWQPRALLSIAMASGYVMSTIQDICPEGLDYWLNEAPERGEYLLQAFSKFDDDDTGRISLRNLRVRKADFFDVPLY